MFEQHVKRFTEGYYEAIQNHPTDPIGKSRCLEESADTLAREFWERVNDRRVNATASQATHETTTSTLALEGGFPADL